MTTTETTIIDRTEGARLTYAWLRDQLDSGHMQLAPGVSIHDHPGSGRPQEIHFMVEGQKVAEIGPTTGTEGVTSDVAPAYIDFLAMWAGMPVSHLDWKNRLQRDNGLIPPERHDVDLLARRVLDLAGRGRVDDALEAGLALARAVQHAHTIHPSYNAATAGSRVRSHVPA